MGKDDVTLDNLFGPIIGLMVWVSLSTWACVLGIDLIMGTYVHFFGGNVWWYKDQVLIIGVWFAIITSIIGALLVWRKWKELNRDA